MLFMKFSRFLISLYYQQKSNQAQSALQDLAKRNE